MLSKLISRQMITYPVTSIVCPLIGGYLSSIHLRLPLAVHALATIASLALVVPQVPETLRKSKRIAKISLAGASPLGAVKLFTQGKQLRKIAWMQLVHSCADGRVTHQIQCAPSTMLPQPWPCAVCG